MLFIRIRRFFFSKTYLHNKKQKFSYSFFFQQSYIPFFYRVFCPIIPLSNEIATTAASLPPFRK